MVLGVGRPLHAAIAWAGSHGHTCTVRSGRPAQQCRRFRDCRPVQRMGRGRGRHPERSCSARGLGATGASGVLRGGHGGRGEAAADEAGHLNKQAAAASDMQTSAELFGRWRSARRRTAGGVSTTTDGAAARRDSERHERGGSTALAGTQRRASRRATRRWESETQQQRRNDEGEAPELRARCR